MHCFTEQLSYRQTNAFSGMILDFLEQSPRLQPFYKHYPGAAGIAAAIEDRKQSAVNREALVSVLREQYAGSEIHEAVRANIESIANPGTFTITTAHQNNIFTGPLYFIYKIVHVIKIADQLNREYPDLHFVPVYYMGNEDADLAELNHIRVNGEKYIWNTKQTGAVGAMQIDKELVKMVDALQGQLTVYPHGQEIIDLFRKHYTVASTITQATFGIVHEIFQRFGLVVLLPDHAELKRLMIPIFQRELTDQFSARIVSRTAERLTAAGYKVQANPRDINLFYMLPGIRERIEEKDGGYAVVNTDLRFTKEEMLTELYAHPERFSPNVILRGLYQETILPNLCYIGGGGESAYWLQLKELFEFCRVPFPVPVLRNSYLILEKRADELRRKLGFSLADLFLSEQEMLTRIVQRDSQNKTQLNGALESFSQFYESVKSQAGAIDSTLGNHVEALKVQAQKKLLELEKKMLRAEKRRFTDQQRQIQTLRAQLFPNNSLQERSENIAAFYAKWGAAFIDELYKHALVWEMEFVVMGEG